MSLPLHILQQFEKLRLYRATEIDQINEEIIQQFAVIENQLVELSSIEAQEVLIALNRIVAAQATERMKGQSNYLFFKFLKLRNIIGRLVDPAARQHKPAKLDIEGLISKLLESRSNLNVEHPTSPADFLALAQKSGVEVLVMPKEPYIPESVPVIFSLNPIVLESIKNQKKVALVTGHCLIGTEPQENTEVAFNTAIDGGLTLHDIFMYQHVRTVAESLAQYFSIEVIAVNFDTDNYYGWFQEVLKTIPGETVVDSIERMVNEQERQIRKILPNCVTFRTHQGEYRNALEEICKDGLVEYILENVPHCMDTDIRANPGKALIAAIVTSTYLYWPLKFGIPTLAIESALDIEIPSKIVLGYLKKIGKEDLFGFLGLFPLPDIRMSHGAMFYGSAPNGKLYSLQSDQEIERRIQRMSRNLDNPHQCFYSNYFIAKNKDLPDKICVPSRCASHVNSVVSDAIITCNIGK